MPVSFLVGADTHKALESSDSYFGHVFIQATSVEDASRFVTGHTVSTHVDASTLTSSEAIAILDAGALTVFVTKQQFQEIQAGALVEDLGRLVVILEVPTGDIESQVESEVEAVYGVSRVVSFCLRGVQTFNTIRRIYLGNMSSRVFVDFNNGSANTIKQALTAGFIPILPATGRSISPESLLLSSLLTDRPDRLYATLVTDERGICLGLVYSSDESIQESLKTGKGVYHSRTRGLWYKGETSGDIQELVKIELDCDRDTLCFTVNQKGDGFCHLKTATCFGEYSGLSKLEKNIKQRKLSAPKESYTSRLFQDPKLLQAKIMEEASELCEAQSREDVAAEAADLLYFAMTRCVAAGVSLRDVERNLDLKSLKTSRRKGDAKRKWAEHVGLENSTEGATSRNGLPSEETVKEAASIPKSRDDPAGIEEGRIKMKRFATSETDAATIQEALKRPSQRSTEEIMNIVKPIIVKVQKEGDHAVLEYTHKFEKATSLKSPVLHAPFPEALMKLSSEIIGAIDTSFDNIKRFHAAQKEQRPLQVETMPGVVCSRFSRPIESVGLYVPGGTAVLPSTALMLGIPAMVAGCKNIVLASPPRADGTLTPEVVYAAHKVGAKSIVLAGGAQAIAAMAYGTESITKVDKILGPGNQFVTAAKMLVSNDTTARVAIDMPAGPSEVLVVADKTANAAFVAADLLSQAEHGVDSQVVCIAVGLDERQLQAIEDELHKQANALPRVDIVRGAINHSVTLLVKDIKEAMYMSNQYAPEHLILQVKNAEEVLSMVENAGSVFVGHWTPESVGDYSAGVNHSLPTYGYAKQYSGVNLASFTKHITSSNLTQDGLRNVSSAVMQLAKVEELEAHRRAVSIRLKYMKC